MKSLINLIVGGAMIVTFLVFTGMIDKQELLNIFAGEVERGETVSNYVEEDFTEVFDIILGEMEVADTARTSFKRKRGLFACGEAFVINETRATIKYEVQSDSTLFYVDVDKMEYYVDPNLDVTYHEADKESNTYITESNCIKEKDIKLADVEKSKRIAERNFKKQIEKSEKLQDARARFLIIKEQVLDKLIDAGFKEVPPTEPLLN